MEVFLVLPLFLGTNKLSYGILYCIVNTRINRDDMNPPRIFSICFDNYILLHFQSRHVRMVVMIFGQAWGCSMITKVYEQILQIFGVSFTC